MGSAEAGNEAVAVSGSALAESRRRALADPGTTILIVDPGMQILIASRQAASSERGPLLGVSLPEALEAPGQSVQIERAVTHALGGTEAQLSIGQGPDGRLSVRCIPLEAGAAGSQLALVAVSQERAADAEIDELRARASDLETLAGAARALARSTYAEEARRTVCEAAASVAESELAALLEMRPDGSGLVVTGAVGAEIEGRSISIDRATMAARAFSSGKPSFSADLGSGETASAWPLRQAGALAGVWQPVRRAVGIRGVIAVGWQHSTSAPSHRLTGSLELLASESAVAIDRAAALERLTGMARTDPLTELSNRRAWQDELSRELARAERGGLQLSIGLIDLDELKAYNDRWGHAAGDRVLLTAAARWRRRLRLTDLLARIGGDEFAVTMPGCGLGEAATLGDQLRSALPDGLSCSIGVAEWSIGESAGELLARADEALYAAKNAGRDATYSLRAPGGMRTGRSVPSR